MDNSVEAQIYRDAQEAQRKEKVYETLLDEREGILQRVKDIKADLDMLGYDTRLLEEEEAARLFIIRSGAGYFVKFVPAPQMTSDPVMATRMPFNQARSVIAELGHLGFQGELVRVVLAEMRPEERDSTSCPDCPKGEYYLVDESGGYCCSTLRFMVKDGDIEGETGAFFIYGKPTVSWGGDDITSETQITFCPFCGERLRRADGKEAV